MTSCQSSQSAGGGTDFAPEFYRGKEEILQRAAGHRTFPMDVHGTASLRSVLPRLLSLSEWDSSQITECCGLKKTLLRTCAML